MFVAVWLCVCIPVCACEYTFVCVAVCLGVCIPVCVYCACEYMCVLPCACVCAFLCVYVLGASGIILFLGSCWILCPGFIAKLKKSVRI